MQIGDEGPHQAGLAHAGSQGEAQRDELALEVLHGGEGGLDALERGLHISRPVLRHEALEPNQVEQTVEGLERVALGLAKAKAVGNVVGFGVHYKPPPFCALKPRDSPQKPLSC